jgi:branched-chain amino acid transport system ATP-binding protein
LANSITIENVHAAYGAVRVLEDVTIAVNSGETVALLGTNGNGKSTLMKCVMGMLRPTNGSITAEIDGERYDLVGRSTEEIVDLGITLVPEGRRLFPKLTVEENLLLGAFRPTARGAIDRNLNSSYETFPRLRERRSQLAGSLSGGEQQMLSLGRALASDPALLLLDELSMGLAPLIVQSLYDSVAEIAEQGVSILVVEQFASSALRVADYAAVMQGGRIIDTGEPGEIEAKLNDLYFGGAA